MKKISRDCSNVKRTVNKLSETVVEYGFDNVKLYIVNGKEHLKSSDWAFTWDFESNNKQLRKNVMEYRGDREKYLSDKRKNHMYKVDE